MKQILLIITVLVFTQGNSQSFEERVTSASNVRLSVTNVGTFGNAFRGYRDGTNSSSCEYPAGSGTEHLFESGIWIGGLQNGTSVLVSTSNVDATQGYRTGASGFEFYGEQGSKLDVRSTLTDHPNYTPHGVSHEDFVCTYYDKFTEVPGTQTPIVSHNQPLFVKVNQKTYNFNFSFSNFVVFVDMEIINEGNPNGGANPIDSLHIGLWANTVVRNTNITPAGSGGAAFYNKGGNGFIDSLNMAFCYDYSGDVGFTNSYIGQRFLGAEDKFGFHHPSLDSTFFSNYNVWQFNNPGTGIFQTPSGDNQRYQKLSKGVEDDPCWDVDNGSCGGGTFQEQLNAEGNRSDLVSVGPFRDFNRGDTIKISYAFILGPKLDDGNPHTDNTYAQMEEFIKNANKTQTAYNGEDVNFNGILDSGEDKDQNGEITRFILPEPPAIPKTRVFAEDNKIDIYWSNNSEFSIDPISQEMDFEGYKVYLTKFGFDVVGIPDLLKNLSLIGEYDIPLNQIGKDAGLEFVKLDNPVNFEGDTNTYYYKYTIDNVLNGWQYAVGVSAFDTGNEEQNVESLSSSLLANNFRVFPGKKENNDIENDAPFAYPNPYYFGASWEGKTDFQEQSRKLIFANLPKRCYIRIFTPAGDMIDEIYHDENYNGSDIKWYESFAAEESGKNKFSGGEHAWDLLSSYTQIVSRGIYMFVVEDIETGKTTKNKFTILK